MSQQAAQLHDSYMSMITVIIIISEVFYHLFVCTNLGYFEACKTWNNMHQFYKHKIAKF